MKYSAIILCILDMLNVGLPGSFGLHNPDRYPRHNFHISRPALPRTDATVKILIAGTTLGLSPSWHHVRQPHQSPFYLQNSRCHNFTLPQLTYCKEWPAELFGYVTNYQQYKHKSCFRQKLLESYAYYTCPGFVHMLKTFPEYEQHILFAAQQIRQSTTWHLYACWYGIENITHNLEQEVRHIRHQRQEIKAIKDALDRQLAHQRDALEDLYSTYEHEPEMGLLGQHQTERAAHGKPLLHATDNREFFGQSYRLKDKTHALLKKHGIESKSIAEFNSCFGTKLQQSVHQEFIDILDGLAAPYRTNQFHDLDKLTIDFATIGVQANKAGKIAQAYSLADFGWVALEQKIRSILPRDLVRTGVAFATETFLTGKCLGAIHTFAHASHTKALDLARKARAGEVVATTAEGFQVRLASKAAKTFSKMEKTGEQIKKAGLTKQKTEKIINSLSNFKSKRLIFDNLTFIIDKSGIKHILERHHPNFWNGTLKLQQTFLDKNISIEQTIKNIEIIMKQNKNILLKKGTNKIYQIQGMIEGKQYIVGINKGRIGQFYCIK